MDRIASPWYLRFLSTAACACALVAQTPGDDGETEKRPELRVTCTSDRLMVGKHEVVEIRVSTNRRSEEALDFKWTTADGIVEAGKHVLEWKLSFLPPGGYTATVEVTDTQRETATCSVEIYYDPEFGTKGPGPSGGRWTGWKYLLSDKEEDGEYGLYSYILIGTIPTGALRARFVDAIDAYLRMARDIEGLEMRLKIPTKRLNATHLLLTTEPPDHCRERAKAKAREWARKCSEWVVEHYDYDRARALLDSIESGKYHEGPYVLSSPEPLTIMGSLPEKHIFQNLSEAPENCPGLTQWWVRAFLGQASQDQFWEQTTKQRVLKLRATIEILACGLDPVKAAVKEWITWSKEV